jgi:hypothetical protein
MSAIPLRYNIIDQLITFKEGMTPKALHRLLEKEYPGEKQCSEHGIDEQLMSMRGVGLVTIKDASLNSEGMLTTTYMITGYGEERARKYIGEYITMDYSMEPGENTI